MPTPDDEDQLEQTKMSFGEHLEELRSALIKSALAIAAGFAIGLLLGWDIVNYVQTPLRDGLENHYKGRVERQELQRLEQLKAAGADVPDNLPEAAKEFAAQGLVPHDLYVDPQSLLEALQARWPERFAGADLPAQQSQSPVLQQDQMLKLQVYQPLAEDPRMRIIGLGVEEPFVVYIKASLVAGIVIASPFVFYFLWEFVAAGLYRSERSYVYTYLPLSIGLFVAGAALAFYVAFGYVLEFLFWFFETTNTDPDPRLSYWITLVLLLPLGFGISFQLPLIMLAIERIGLVSIDLYLRKWRIAVLIICTLSMFLTPADPMSMVIMATPLVALYFGGILLCKYMPGAHGKAERLADPD
ncbi:MAG: twin-arginine translocase subunit TatC [Planctomycetales bacterium]|nr:twin-arginine translocase subunit TatC [Planctomycetales bacterium]